MGEIQGLKKATMIAQEEKDKTIANLMAELQLLKTKQSPAKEILCDFCTLRNKPGTVDCLACGKKLI